MPLQNSPDIKSKIVVQVDWQNTFIYYFKCSKCHCTRTDTLSTFSERLIHCHTRLPITVSFFNYMPLQNSPDIKSNIVVHVDWQTTFIYYLICSKWHCKCTGILSTFSGRLVLCHTRLPITVSFTKNVNR